MSRDTTNATAMNQEEHSVRYEPYRGGPICTRCGHQGEPLEPLFDMKLAAELIPMRYATLMNYLSDHRSDYPPLYRRDGSVHRRIRLLSASEIKRIRAQVLKGPGIKDSFDRPKKSSE